MANSLWQNYDSIPASVTVLDGSNTPTTYTATAFTTTTYAGMAATVSINAGSVVSIPSQYDYAIRMLNGRLRKVG